MSNPAANGSPQLTPKMTADPTMMRAPWRTDTPSRPDARNRLSTGYPDHLGVGDEAMVLMTRSYACLR